MNDLGRVLIYGSGAIGSYVGALLSEAGADVTLLARGAHANAIARAGGLMFQQPGGRDRHVPVKVCRPGETVGRYDTVFVGLKATQLAQCAQDMMRVLAAEGSLVMLQNGLPWWYFDGLDSPLRGTALRCLDPQGELARSIDLRRVVGGVIYRSAELAAPGVLLAAVIDWQRLQIGELDGTRSDRCSRIASGLEEAGLPVEVTADIRTAKWEKLIGNLVWNPLSALTQSAYGHIPASPRAAELAAALVQEGTAVAKSVGVTVKLDAKAQLARKVGNFTEHPSMLQDVRAGRPLELDAIVNSVIEIAALTGVAVPTLKTIAACLTLLDERIRMDGVAIGPSPRG